ncbi:MAG TPA: sigma factor-like helix-turn-helix DNA-binding protein, partial [Planctomycetota bacterium]|nr:sigma factor-like helix-turn-helix DNA-binding protein [Planctomycetota bacterium]
STVLRRYFDDASFEEIAVADGVPASTVRARHRRALSELRARLAGDDPRRAAFAIPGGTTLCAGAKAASAPGRRFAGETAWKASHGGALAAAAGGWIVTIKIKAATVVAALAGVALWIGVAHREAGPADEPGRLDAVARRAQVVEESGGRSVGPPEPEILRTTFTDATTTRMVSGRVRGPFGRPLAGAAIALCTYRAAAWIEMEDGVCRETLASGTTDARGAFAIDPGDAAGPFAVCARAPGTAPRVAGPIGRGEAVVLDLEDALQVEARVLDLDDRPVPGAGIRTTACLDGIRVTETTTCDSAGRAAFAWFGGLGGFGQGGRIDVDAAGYAPSTASTLGRRDATGAFRKDFYLVRGHAVHGRVVDAETGAPIEGAEAVALIERPGSPTGLPTSSGLGGAAPYAFVAFARATTDAQGRFRLSGLPSWGVDLPPMFGPDPRSRRMGSVVVSKVGYVDAAHPLDLADEGAEIEKTFRCRRPGRVAGRVVDGRGRPVARATVTWNASDDGFASRSHRSGAAPPPCLTDASGRYVLEGVPRAAADDAGLQVRLLARGGEGLPLSASSTEVVATFEGEAFAEARDLVIAVDPSSLARVRVRGPDGGPLQARIRQEGEPSEESTDADGLLVLRFVDQDDPTVRRIVVQAPGMMTQRVDVPPSAETAQIDVVLRRGRTLRGVVRHDDGAAAPFRPIVARGAARNDLAPADRNAATDDRPRPLASTSSDGFGRFLLDGLPDGPWRIEVLEGATSTDVAAERCVADAREPVEIVVPTPAAPAPEGIEGRADLVVTVRRADGVRVLKATVEAEGGPKLHALAGVGVAPGRFLLADLPFGTWKVRAWVDGCTVPDAVVFRHGDGLPREFAITAEVGARLRGRLRKPDGAPFRESYAYLQGPGFPRFVVAADGAFDAPGLRRDATYRFVVTELSEPRRTFVSEPVAAPASDDAPGDLVVPVRAGAGLTVYLKCLKLGFPHGETEATRRLAEASTLTFLAADGTVVAKTVGVRPNFGACLPLGDYRIRLEIPGSPPAERTATVSDAHSLVWLDAE